MLDNGPLISICIPVYKNVGFLERLVSSILSQQFRDFEVIISDDSNDDLVKEYIKNKLTDVPVGYFQNTAPLGAPANWNNAISKASGKWIKLMHDDDWFADEKSLEFFAKTAELTTTDFIFSGFNNIVLETGQATTHVISSMEKRLLSKAPYNLLKKNFVGHPSTTLIRNKPEYRYDETLKWLVDIEFYIRVLSANKASFFSLDRPLINIGIGKEQITKIAFRNPAIEIPENVYLLNKLSVSALKHIWAYDYYWRFIRNLKIKNIETLQEYGVLAVPVLLKKMILQQKKIPGAFMIKIISKLTMVITYAWNRLKGRMD